MTRPLFSVAALAAVLVAPQHSANAAKPGGAITDLGTLGGNYSDAFGINNDPTSLQVVGQSRTVSGAVHAFFWTAPGPMIDLGTLGGGHSYASHLNNHGLIAGGSDDALAQRWAVVWTDTGGRWVIENIGTLTGSCCANAYGVNNGTAGDPAAVAVVGGSTAGSGRGHAVMWTRSSTGWTLQDLGVLPGDTSSLAIDINDRGEIVGVSNNPSGVGSGFLLTPATGMFRLSSLGGDTEAVAINDAGDVAGFSTTSSGDVHAVRWQSATNWTVEDLGSLGGCCSQASGINNYGDVVGVSNVSQRRSGLQHAFLARSGGLVTDLGSLSGSSIARDVNDFSVAAGSSGGAKIHAALWKLQ